MSLVEIRNVIQHISEIWRSETATEQEADLAELDTLLRKLDDAQRHEAAGGEQIDELRGRIEILTDEIDIHLGIEPAPMTSSMGSDINFPNDEDMSG